MQELDPYSLKYQRRTVHWNAFYGKYSLVTRWLAAGGDINKRDQRGQTPLHAAIHGRQHRITRYLIEHGADVNISSNESPYHTYAIQTAVYDGDLNIVQALVAAGADISVRTSNGCALLHLAAFNDHSEVAAFLLQLGMDVDVLNDAMQTPLRDAAMHSHLSISLVFLQASANANAADDMGFTPLFEVCNEKLIQVLVEYGADINHRNNEGQTPLFYACDPAVVDLLIALGAMINLTDVNGETPLHYASHNCDDPRVIAKLLPFFPDINIKDNEGHTPLWHAIDFWQEENVNFLRLHGGIT